MDSQHLACCFCLACPAVLPVRPHGDGFLSCLCIFCRDCYHDWRHGHGWDRSPPPACPWCRAPVHPNDVPPDGLLVALLADTPVACPSCQLATRMGRLQEHQRRECAATLVAWLRDSHHDGPRLMCGGAGAGRHGPRGRARVRPRARVGTPRVARRPAAVAPGPPPSPGGPPMRRWMAAPIQAWRCDALVARAYLRDDGFLRVAVLGQQPVGQRFLTQLAAEGSGTAWTAFLEDWERDGPPCLVSAAVLFRVGGSHPVLGRAGGAILGRRPPAAVGGDVLRSLFAAATLPFLKAHAEGEGGAPLVVFYPPPSPSRRWPPASAPGRPGGPPSGR